LIGESFLHTSAPEIAHDFADNSRIAILHAAVAIGAHFDDGQGKLMRQLFMV
jgi:hypothetical protein